MLSDPTAFDCLKPDQKVALIALLPPWHTVVDPSGTRRPSPDFLLSNPDWAQSIAAFQKDLEDGRCNPKWMADAIEAHEEHCSGFYDEFKLDKFEKDWSPGNA
jgi:hypothetical protein